MHLNGLNFTINYNLEKHLHIIAFNVPYPTDNGGACDVFHKLPAFQAQGIKIHLHCFDDGRGEQTTLNQYCESVNYYKKLNGHKGFSTQLPYMVSSRINELLYQNLLKDNHPIFMEGVQCTYLLQDTRFKNRRCFVRLHNIAYRYYKELYQHSSSVFKKAYYWNESRLMKSYEKTIADKATFWASKEADNDIYRNEFECVNIEELELYLPDWSLSGEIGMGAYCFYHGDLSEDINEKAVIWLLENVFKNMEIPFVIAGKNPSKKLEALAYSSKYSCLVANPSQKELQDMIAKAHINLIPSYIYTGTKVTLLNAIFNGRHIIANDATVAETGLITACHIGNTANAFKHLIEQLFHQPYTAKDINIRKHLLENRYSNEQNAIKQVGWIFGE